MTAKLELDESDIRSLLREALVARGYDPTDVIEFETEEETDYADRGIVGWKRAYYAENLERLVATKHAVDPANRFRHAQSIPTSL